MSWKKVKLGEICEMSSGGTPRRGVDGYYNGNIPWAKISDVEKSNCYISDTEEKISEAGLANINNRIFPAGTLFLAMYGSVGKVTISKVQMSTNQAILGIRPKAANTLDLKYLKYWFLFIQEQLLNRAVGGTLQNISLTIVKNLEVPLPPFETQQKIASILNKTDVLRRKGQQLLDKYNELLQSIFYQTFGDPVKNERGWKTVRLGEVVETRLGKMLDAKKISGHHLFKYLGNSNVLWNSFDLKNLKEMDFLPEEREEFNLRKGDILMCEGGEVGRCAIWKEEGLNIFFQKALHRIRVNKKMLNEHFFVWLMFEYSKNNGYKNYVSSVTIPHLTGVKLKSMIIPLPPIQLQEEFASKIESLENQMNLCKSSVEKSEFLFQSLLRKAFKGELVK